LPLLPSALHAASESGAKDFALKQLSVFDTCVSVERTSDEWAIVKRNTYDDLARLLSNSCTSAVPGAWSQSFGYDVFGNMTQSLRCRPAPFL
jgi:hypothetical protein